MKIQAAFSAQVRGQAGDMVGKMEKLGNIDTGKEIGGAIQAAFLDVLHLHIPHKHEQIIEYIVGYLDKNIPLPDGLVESDVIVGAYCDLVADMDLLIVFTGNGISAGMKAEMESAKDNGVKIFEFADWNEHTEERLARVIAGLKGEGE